MVAGRHPLRVGKRGGCRSVDEKAYWLVWDDVWIASGTTSVLPSTTRADVAHGTLCVQTEARRL